MNWSFIFTTIDLFKFMRYIDSSIKTECNNERVNVNQNFFFFFDHCRTALWVEHFSYSYCLFNITHFPYRFSRSIFFFVFVFSSNYQNIQNWNTTTCLIEFKVEKLRFYYTTKNIQLNNLFLYYLLNFQCVSLVFADTAKFVHILNLDFIALILSIDFFSFFVWIWSWFEL